MLPFQLENGSPSDFLNPFTNCDRANGSFEARQR